MDNNRLDRNTTNLAIGAAVVQWLLLTFALGTMIIYTDRSMEGLLGYHLDSGYAFFGAIVVGFLIGATIERTKLLILLVAASCLAAAGMYVGLLFYPVLTGTLVHTVGLENFATTRALLYLGLSGVPVSLGAMAGRLLGSLIPGGDILRRMNPADNQSWWLDRSPTEKAQSDAPPTR